MRPLPLMLWLVSEGVLRDFREELTLDGVLVFPPGSREKLEDRARDLEKQEADDRTRAFGSEHTPALREALGWWFTDGRHVHETFGTGWTTIVRGREWERVARMLNIPQRRGAHTSTGIEFSQLLPEPPLLTPSECSHDGHPGSCMACHELTCLDCRGWVQSSGDEQVIKTAVVWCIRCSLSEVKHCGTLGRRGILRFQRWWNEAAGDDLAEDGILGPATRAAMEIVFDANRAEHAERLHRSASNAGVVSVPYAKTIANETRAMIQGVRPHALVIDDPNATAKASEDEDLPRGKRRGRDGKTDQERGRAHLEALQKKRRRR